MRGDGTIWTCGDHIKHTFTIFRISNLQTRAYVGWWRHIDRIKRKFMIFHISNIQTRGDGTTFGEGMLYM